MTTTPFEIVIVSSDMGSKRRLGEILTTLGFDPICVSTLRGCREILTNRKIGLVFCDPHVSDGPYKDLLSTDQDGKPRIVLKCCDADWDQRKDAMSMGAFAVISSPCRPRDVEWMVIQAIWDERRLTEQQSPSVQWEHILHT
jgi:DNA-binding NtrC family response regulator